MATRVLWITILAMSDENGFISSSRSGLLRASNIPPEDFKNALTSLESPDPESRTPDNDGIRIKKIDGGWIILNFLKYRARSEIIREQNRERVRKFREKNKNEKPVTQCNVTETLPSASVSVSDSLSVSDNKNTSTDTVDSDKEQFDLFRKNYPGTKRGLETEYANFKKKHKDYKKVIPLLSQSLSDQKGWRVEMRDAEMFVPEWKMLQTWINQRCWEMEKPEIINKNKSGTDILREREARGEKI